MLKTVFLNADASRPTCALYQDGFPLVDSLNLSKYMTVDMVDVFNNREQIIPDLETYDIAIYNYARNNFFYVNGENYKKARINIVHTLDTTYEAPWSFWCEYDRKALWDYITFPDPTYETDDPSVVVMPRCVPRTDLPERRVDTNYPIISCYGFPYKYRNIERIVETMNEEFIGGLFRMHHPSADPTHTREQELIAETLKNCKAIAKKGIEIEFDNKFLSRDEMIAWLHQSDANVFMSSPERFADTKGSLPAGIDWAISTKRPIIVSDTLEMRHVMSYVDPFPLKSFREIMSEGIEPVLNMYNDWSPQNIADTFDNFLEGAGIV